MATISEDEDNFVRKFMLLTKVAPRAVRILLDREIPPPLSVFVNNNIWSLQSLYNTRVLNGAQWTVLKGKWRKVCLRMKGLYVIGRVTGWCKYKTRIDSLYSTYGLQR